MAHWDAVARRGVRPEGFRSYYQRRLADVYRHAVAPGERILEIGCGEGDLLAFLEPSVGVGVDFSLEMLERARKRHPGANLRFVQADAHELELDETFDVIVLADTVNDVWDVQRVLERLRPLCHARTRIMMNFFSRLWEKPLSIGRRFGLAQPVLEQNWLLADDVINLLNLAGFETIRYWEEILWPLRTPVIDTLMNRFLVRLPFLRHGAITHMLVARPGPGVGTAKPPFVSAQGRQAADAPEPIVSVIVPARNEEGNIESIFRRVPEMGGGTELIFVEGNSTDKTYQKIEETLPKFPQRRAKLLKQPGKGKGDAVRAGFAAASGEVLMILDADLTVPPEDLPRFYAALRDNRGEFINGVRLVYPMERQSMQFLNLVANKLFGLGFTWLLGQPVKDTLCGTKVLTRHDYDLIARNRKYFGDFDPFGDFDLLFGAAKLNLKITDMPIRYRERTYGTTNISRFRHGWMLLRLTVFAARRLKFV